MKHLHAAFSAATFREQGVQVVHQLADLLEAVQRREGAVLPWQSPAALATAWEERMAGPLEPVTSFLAAFAEQSIKLHHPRYVGHQVCAPAPAAALAGLVAELLNNGMAIYEMGPTATALERWIIQRCGQVLGFPEGEGYLTSGGTLATLTALLAARARQLGESTFAEGTAQNWSVMASEESHYCTARAVQVMGGGSEGLVTVPTDERFRMRVDCLDERYEAACARGRRPFALVASACSTSTGSYDPLPALADFCQRRRLWLHVDAAHGGAAAFCPELRDRLIGLERADSAIMDFHKLLLTPALATAVIFRERASAWAAFHQRAQYLFAEGDVAEYDGGKKTYECTKLSMSVKIAAIWRAHGEELLSEHLRTVHTLARNFAARLRQRAPFEVAVEPESNIVCFRLRPPGLEESAVDALNAAARRRIVESGQFYLVQTTLRGRVWLRTALMNPFTTLADLEELLDTIEQP